MQDAETAIAASEPATNEELGVMLHQLSLHYPDRKLNDKEAYSVGRDWLRDLQGIPADILTIAFDRWRTGPKCTFFPKSGEILGLVKTELAFRKMLAKRAKEVSDALKGEGN